MNTDAQFNQNIAANPWRWGCATHCQGQGAHCCGKQFVTAVRTSEEISSGAGVGIFTSLEKHSPLYMNYNQMPSSQGSHNTVSLS